MLVPLCDCNRHFFFLPSKTLVNHSFQIPSYHYPVFPFKSLCRRGSVSAAASEAETRAVPQSAIQRIAEKLRSLGYVDESSDDGSDEASIPVRNSPGEIFVPLPTRLPKHRVGHTLDPSWSTPENPVPDPGSGRAMQRLHELRRGVLEEEEKERIRKRTEGKKERAPTLAELTLPKEELVRLRSSGIGLKNKLKVGKAGITEGIVNGIHERWRRSELVKITCEDICRLNMKRTHELLERKTGGLVIWRSGSNIILYRGSGYKYPYFLANESLNDSSSEESRDIDINQSMPGKVGPLSPVISAAESPGQNSDIGISRPPLVQGVGLPNRVRFQLPGEAEYADEADALLEGLGPRFDDWWGCEPLPVDADLLPAVVPGYRRPFRLLPYGVKPKLTNDEMTILKRLGRPLPCHFALGRNRKLQGLAASIVKLWEKCEIAKIAVKRGVQNTNSVLMAKELKWLTGGTVLSRDREFIVFYRGKDFLPAAVSSAIEERRKNGIDMSKTGTGEGKEHKLGGKEYGTDAENDNEKDQRLQGHSEERKPRFSEAAIDRTDSQLSLAIAKKEKAEKLLAKLQEEEILKPAEMDKEGITEEERYMLRKVGLRMKPFLLLGRRGVFAGTVENMHLHWKYRELVKVCIGGRPIEEIHGIARTLEAESGGILVAIERVSKGYAIIVYRGKNYTRPPSLRPRTLLSKREAMKRSIEAQRRESLKLHVLKLSKNIDELKLRMAKGEDTKNMQLTEDSNIGYETKVNFDNDGTWFDGMPENDHEFVSGDLADEPSEGPGTDVTSKGLEDPLRISKDTAHIGLWDLPRDISPESEVKGNYLSDAAEAEIRLGPLLQETNCFQSMIQQCGNVEHSHSLEPEDQLMSSTVSYPQLETRGRDPQPETGGRDSQPEIGGRDSSVDGCKNIDVEPHVQNAAVNEKPPVMPSRGSQLSNRERLLLRKQALRMKKPPVLAVGKSNVITGIAKVIKAHFKKHPLAIVNIKGRAKGTSAQEVIYNLEQATGAVLVSQEPSKVILYRGWGSGVDPEQAGRKDSKNESRCGEVKTQRPISPELMSAIRFECGLPSADEKHTASKQATACDN